MTTEENLRILRHALGLNPDGTGTPYRAHYCAGQFATADTHKSLATLLDDGFMTIHAQYPLDHVFHVTDAGRAFVDQHSPASRRSAIMERIGNLDDETLFTLADCFLDVA